MDIPQTVRTALADQPVCGSTCLEAGAGVGNTTAGLLAEGCARVYAVTNDGEHATTVRERVGREESDRTAVLEADLRDVPLSDDSIELITAHGLFNVLAPDALGTVVAELTRVAKPGCRLVVDDYAPLPDDAAVSDLFAVENAITELAEGRPALTFYPVSVLRRLFAGYGWEFDRKRILLDPVPWTASHVEAHTEVVRRAAETLSSDVGESLLEEAERLAAEIGEESVGEMYSVAMRLPR
ncbi:class I SAM-dependent methyltransferase [Halorussus halophilus]|uniref:class I SAM-dependent methyltransferase n=1 Tax=Halorussus halophilus TaxID=2650975 RepID=UPI0013013E3F|nr:class I SAM-dependent methyltransferase [Halorussus halophilus]